MVRLAFDDAVEWGWYKQSPRVHTLWIKLANGEVHEIHITKHQVSQDDQSA